MIRLLAVFHESQEARPPRRLPAGSGRLSGRTRHSSGWFPNERPGVVIVREAGKQRIYTLSRPSAAGQRRWMDRPGRQGGYR